MKTKSVIINILLAIVSAISLINMILTIVSYSKVSDGVDFIDTIKTNHIKFPLSGFNNDFFNKNIFGSVEYPGSSSGCDCSLSIKYLYKGITSGTCTTDEYRGGCNTIYTNFSKTLSIWREKKELKSTFLNENYKTLYKRSVAKGSSCSSGLKPCGVLDSLGNILCLENSQQCPINDLKISQSMPDKDYKNDNSDYKYTSLWYSNKKIKMPIVVEVTDTEGNSVCSNVKEYLSNEPYYVLDNNHYGKSSVRQCSALNGKENLRSNKNFLQIDTQKKRDLFYANSFTPNNYPLKVRNEKENTDVYLFRRNYIGWSHNCPLSLEDFYSFNIDKGNLGLILGLSIGLFVISILLLIFSFFRFKLFTTISIGILYSAGCIANSYFSNNYDPVNLPNGIKTCVDEIVVEYFNIYERGSYQSDSLLITVCILGIIGVLLILGSIVLVLLENRNENENNTEDLSENKNCLEMNSGNNYIREEVIIQPQNIGYDPFAQNNQNFNNYGQQSGGYDPFTQNNQTFNNYGHQSGGYNPFAQNIQNNENEHYRNQIHPYYNEYN